MIQTDVEVCEPRACRLYAKHSYLKRGKKNRFPDLREFRSGRGDEVIKTIQVIFYWCIESPVRKRG